jgi:hypothetical protein
MRYLNTTPSCRKKRGGASGRGRRLNSRRQGQRARRVGWWRGLPQLGRVWARRVCTLLSAGPPSNGGQAGALGSAGACRGRRGGGLARVRPAGGRRRGRGARRCAWRPGRGVGLHCSKAGACGQFWGGLGRSADLRSDLKIFGGGRRGPRAGRRPPYPVGHLASVLAGGRRTGRAAALGRRPRQKRRARARGGAFWGAV